MMFTRQPSINNHQSTIFSPAVNSWLLEFGHHHLQLKLPLGVGIVHRSDHHPFAYGRNRTGVHLHLTDRRPHALPLLVRDGEVAEFGADVQHYIISQPGDVATTTVAKPAPDAGSDIQILDLALLYFDRHTRADF